MEGTQPGRHASEGESRLRRNTSECHMCTDASPTDVSTTQILNGLTEMQIVPAVYKLAKEMEMIMI